MKEGFKDDDRKIIINDRNHWVSLQFFVCRWRLALKTLPIIATMIGFRFAVWHGAGVGGWVDPSVFTSFILLAVFVSAVLLQGVVQDFKESEKMPSELQSAFWSLTCELEKASKFVKSPLNEDLFMQRGLTCVVDMLFCIISTLDRKDDSSDEVFENISSTMRTSEVNLYTLFNEYKVKPKKLAKLIEIVRKILGRMYVIQATSYIPQCYTLMDCMVLIVFTLMTTANWPKETGFETAITFTVIITFLFSFLWFMVRSLEDPFEYPPNYNMKCFSESAKINMNLFEEFISVGSIDMSAVTVGFGNHIKNLCVRCGLDVLDAIKQRKEELSNSITGHERKDTSISAKILRRWNIFAWTLPAISAMIGFRMAVWYGANVDGWIAPQTFTSFISLTVFVTALLLQGLIQDYKESEKMPSDLLNAFQGLTAAVQSAYASSYAGVKNSSQRAESSNKIKSLHSNYVKALKSIEKLLLSIAEILDSEGDVVADEMFNKATTEIREAEKEVFIYLINSRAFDVIAGAAKPLATIRNLAGRINVIKKTSYILAGYSLADSMILIVFILMTLSKWPVNTKWTVAISFTVVITFLFTYLAILIRKVEDPFTNPKGSERFNTECYESGLYEKKALTDNLGCIDMSAVTIVFGRQLKSLLSEALYLQEKCEGSGSGSNSLPAQKLQNIQKNPPSGKISNYLTATYLLKRWRVAISSIPLVVLLISARMVVWYGIEVGGWMDPSVFTTFIGIVIFIAVILIQGIIQDYKEAEKIPSDLFSAFEGLAAAVEIAHEVGTNRKQVKETINLTRSATHIEKILIAVLHVVEDGGIESYKQAMAIIQEEEVSLNEDLCRLNAHNGGASAAIEAIVKVTGRLHVIQATSYISAGYTLMNLSLCLVFALVTACNWPLSSAMSVAIAYTLVISYLYTYLRVIISDLEDPFEYPENYCFACYVSGKSLSITAWEEFRKGGSISSMSMLTVTFGMQLKELMTKVNSSDKANIESSVREDMAWDSWPFKKAYKEGQDLLDRIDQKLKLNGLSDNDKSHSDLCAASETNQEGAQGRVTTLRVKEPKQRTEVKNVSPSAKDILRNLRLALRCIPVVAVALGMRLAVWFGAGIGGWIEQNVFTSFISLAIFVSAIVMQGLLQDYKEAEKMPSELTSALFALTGALQIDSRWAQVTEEMAEPISENHLSYRPQVEQIRDALLAVFKILELPDNGSAPFVFSQAMAIIDQAQTNLACTHAALEDSVKKMSDSRGQIQVYPGAKFDKPFERLRAALSRMYAIQKTSYILEGYTLMDLMMVAVVTLMTAANWPRETATSTAIAFTTSISFLFAYLQFLVRDLEDPFKYPAGHSVHYFKTGALEFTYLDDHKYGGSIDLAPLCLAFGCNLKALFLKNSELKTQLEQSDFDVIAQNRWNELFTLSDEEDGFTNSKFSGNSSETGDHLIYFIQRFRIVLQTIPCVLCMVALRFAVWRAASVSGWIEPAVFTSFVGLVIFVTSLLVQGVLTDYKEAEKLPCQLAASLQSLINAVSVGCKIAARVNQITPNDVQGKTKESLKESKNHQSEKGITSYAANVFEHFFLENMELETLARAACLFHVQNVLEQSLRILNVEDSEENSMIIYNDAMREIQDAELGIFEIFKTKKGYSDGAWDAVVPFIEVRQALGRIHVIKQTSFTLDGYALCDGMLLAVLLLLTLSKWPEATYPGTALGTTVILSGLFIYMALLIRSLEDPFKYPTKKLRGAGTFNAKVDLGYCEGLYRSIQKMPALERFPSSLEGFAADKTGKSVPSQNEDLAPHQDGGSAPAFDWLAAFECGSPIDLSVLAQGVGYQVRQLFRKIDPRYPQKVLAIVKPWLGTDFFQSAFKFQVPAPLPSSPALLDKMTVPNETAKVNASSSLVWCIIETENSKANSKQNMLKTAEKFQQSNQYATANETDGKNEPSIWGESLSFLQPRICIEDTAGSTDCPDHDDIIISCSPPVLSGQA